MLVNGKWTEDWQPVQATDAKGGFVRQVSSFRNWVTPDGGAGPTGDGGYAAAAGRYHLYVALICPWASRTLIARKLKRLDEAVTVTVVEPELSDQGWRFAGRDPLTGATYLHELYTRADRRFTGRATVPVRAGGSIPVVPALQKGGAPVLLTGIGLPDDGLHSPNEKVNVQQIVDGIQVFGKFFQLFADRQ